MFLNLLKTQARQAAGQMLEGFKDRADGMPYALYILQTPSPRHTDQVKVGICQPLPPPAAALRQYAHTRRACASSQRWPRSVAVCRAANSDLVHLCTACISQYCCPP